MARKRPLPSVPTMRPRKPPQRAPSAALTPWSFGVSGAMAPKPLVLPANVSLRAPGATWSPGSTPCVLANIEAEFFDMPKGFSVVEIAHFKLHLY